MRQSVGRFLAAALRHPFGSIIEDAVANRRREPAARAPSGASDSLPLLLPALLLALLAGSAAGRTILLEAEDADQVAGISAIAPRMSWACRQAGSARFHNAEVGLTQDIKLLMRFPLDEIPDGQRIAHAELIVPVVGFSGNEPRFYVWRLLKSWGVGVCHDYRRTEPEKQPWTRPGAAGIASDRAPRPTDIERTTQADDVVINVTEDVELWYEGAADNAGWLLSVEDPGVLVRLASPVWHGSERWRLRITYEPDPAAEGE